MQPVPPRNWNDHWTSLQARGYDEGPWSHWVPLAWQAAADPDGKRELPQPPPPAELAATIAYWTPLLHLACYGLGWPSPARGLARWWAAGMAADDPGLAVVRRWWGPALPDFLAFAQQPGTLSFTGAIDYATTARTLHDDPVTDLPLASHLQAEVRRRQSDPLWQQVWAGGGDPLHLGHALSPIRPEDSQSGRVVRLAIEKPGRAVLTTNRYDGWYASLVQRGNALPPLSSGSWRVSVFCLPIGYLGTYRRSRVSGRWFASRHRHHELGY